jgi:TadE-like protein
MNRFSRCTRGVAAVEFALLLPLLMTMLLGSFEIMRYIIASQKLDHIAFTSADVVAQETSITNAQINDIMSAAVEIMEPFPFGDVGVVIVSSVQDDPVRGPVVRWQITGGGTLVRDSEIGETGDDATLPRDLILNDGDNVIIAEVFYMYTPVITEDYFGTRENYKYAIYKPRYGALTTPPN